MQKTFFLDHTADIWAVAKAQGVTVDVAFEKFAADVRSGGAELAENTNNHDLDFGALKATWDAATKQEQEAAVAEYKFFSQQKYDAIVEAAKVGKDAIAKVAADYKAAH